eukprot:183260_1
MEQIEALIQKHMQNYRDTNTVKAPELEGQYEIIENIGQGGFGTVYKAIDLKYADNRIVAIKRIQTVNIHTNDHNFPYTEIRLLNEFKSYSNFPTLHQILIDSKSGSYSIIMDYFEYDPFHTYVNKLNEHDTIRYVFELLSCIHHLCAKGYVHRDIKPSNFLYNHTHKKYMLIDFGMCQKQQHITTQHTKDVQLINTNSARNTQLPPYFRNGTSGYRAPEIILATNNQDSRIDVYSAGLILASIMTGVNRIFTAQSDYQQLTQYINIYGLHQVYATAKILNRKIEIRGLRKSVVQTQNHQNKIVNEHGYTFSYWTKKRLIYLRQNDTHRKWSEDMYNLLDQLTAFNPFLRPTPSKALKNKLFLSLNK